MKAITIMTSKRLIGKKSLLPIGLGCMSLSQAYFPLRSESDAEALLHQAIDIGDDHLHTASLYGLGHNLSLIHI